MGRPSPARVVAAWAVHLFTASSAPAGLLALVATVRGDARTAFLWMAYTLAVDAVDGTLARRVGVKEVLPFVDGSRLDDVVDYFTYVIVPAFFLVQMGLLPPRVDVAVASLVLVASGYGFAQTAAKTPDHFFTGFPSYWNVVAFYLHGLGWSPEANAAVLTLLAVLVFVPLRYLYPSRMTELRLPTVALGVAWGTMLLYGLVSGAVPRPVLVGSLAYPVYYVALSLWFQFRRITA
jgi:phosphatidylcholine synthase